MNHFGFVFYLDAISFHDLCGYVDATGSNIVNIVFKLSRIITVYLSGILIESDDATIGRMSIQNFYWCIWSRFPADMNRKFLDIVWTDRIDMHVGDIKILLGTRNCFSIFSDRRMYTMFSWSYIFWKWYAEVS